MEALRHRGVHSVGFLMGTAIGWLFRPYRWNKSFLQTLILQTADHSIEYYAERVLLFVLMAGAVGAWFCGIAAILMTKLKSSSGRPCPT